MAVRFQLRRDTAANWTSANSVLALGEPGVETDTLKVKVGDGSTAWNSLAYSITKDFTDLTSTPTTLAGYGITDALALAGLSVTQNAASGTGAITYNNATGVFSYTPPNFEGLNGNFTGSVFADDSTIMVDGVAATLNLANNTTTDLTEGTNLYYTDVRADARIAAAGITDLSDADQTVQTTDNVTFSSVTGNVITTQIDSADSSAIEIQTDVTMLAGLTVGNHIIPSSNENIDLGSASARFRDLYLSGNSAVIGDLALKRHASGGLLVSDHSSGNATNLTTHDIVANNITTAGYLRGPASFVIDPAAFGDDTGTVVIAGNLQVDGVQTTINSTTISIDDLNLTLASGAANASAANGAGITIDGASATFTYVSASDRWTMNKDLAADLVGNVTGNVTGSAGTVTSLSNRSVGDFPDVDITTSAPTNNQVLVWDNANGKFIPGDAAADFTDLTGTIAASQIPNSIITREMLTPTNVFSQEFTANGSTTAFTLSADPGSKNAIQVFIDGVPQRASNYTVVGTTLTLGGTPVNGQVVEVRGYGIGIAVGTVADDSITGAKIQDGTIGFDKIQASNYYAADTFTGDGNTAAYTLSTDPGSPYAVTVYVAGVWQKPITNYNVFGTTLAFTSNVPNSEEVYVRFGSLGLAVGTVTDVSVTNAKLNLTYTSNQYTGDNTTTAYTIASGHTINSVLVILDGLILPPVDYSISGTTLTFTSAPLTSQSIDIRYMPV